MHYCKRYEWKSILKLFSVCNYTISKAYYINVHLPLYITPRIQICTTKPVFSLHGLWNSLSDQFCADVIYSKSVVLSLKHVQCSRDTFKRWRFVYYNPCTRLQNFVNVSPLLEIHSFPHFSLTCFDILSWNFAYDFVLLYYRSSLSVINLRQFLWELCPFWNLEILENTQFSTLFSYMLWHIEIKFFTWLCLMYYISRLSVISLCPYGSLCVYPFSALSS